MTLAEAKKLMELVDPKRAVVRDMDCMWSLDQFIEAAKIIAASEQRCKHSCYFGTPNCEECKTKQSGEEVGGPCTKVSNSSEKPNTSEAHVHPKASEVKTQKMLDRVLGHAYQVTKFTILAMLEPKEKERDQFIEKVMEHTEQIEKQYSTNWH